MKYKKIAKIILNIFLGILLLFAILISVSLLPIKNNIKVMTVMSGSMEPAIKTGSLIFIRPVAEYNVGDVATFRETNNNIDKKTTTHRLYSKETIDDHFVFETKGDANDGPDSRKINKDQILGKYFLGIPYLGYLIAFIKTLPGLIIIIIIPAAIIIYEEIKKIHREAKEILEKRKAKKSSTQKSSKKSSDPKANNLQATTYNLSKRGGKRASKAKKNN